MSDNESNKDGPTRKRVSLVWKYFEKLSSARVKCRICEHEQRYMGNTANALRHLKVKHDIDARAIGLADPENVKRMKALGSFGIQFKPSVSSISIKNESHIFDGNDHHDEDRDKDDVSEGENLLKYSSGRQRLEAQDSDADVDPYGSNEEPLVDFIDTNNHYDNKIDEDEPLHHYRNSKSTQNRKRSSLENERIKAEIEYFREKAGYFRIQKHFTALQAKKVKFELEQLQAK